MFQTQARRVVLGVRQASAARILLAGKVPVSGLKRPFPCAPASASIHTTPHVSSQKKAHPKSSEEEDEDEFVINGKAGEGEVLDEAALREALDQGEISFDEIEEFENEMGFEDDEDINDPEAMFRAGVTEPQRIGETEAELFGSDVSEVPRTPREGLDPRQLPIVINSLADLGPNFTEEAYASALIHGRSIHKPFVHPTTMHIPVCSIQFLSYHPRLLTLFTHFAMHAASALGIPTSRGVVMLPTERRLWTVPRSPFVHKKSQENFERRTHKRMIKAWDADGEVVERWLRYLRKHEMGGVGMRVTRWDRMPIGIGRTRMENVERALSAPGLPGSGEEAEGDPDVKLAEVREEIDSSANRKKAILALGQKIVKEEKMASQGQGIVIDVKTDVKDESQSKKA